MEQKQKRRRPWHRLLVLFACLLALTQAGWSYDYTFYVDVTNILDKEYDYDGKTYKGDAYGNQTYLYYYGDNNMTGWVTMTPVRDAGKTIFKAEIKGLSNKINGFLFVNRNNWPGENDGEKSDDYPFYKSDDVKDDRVVSGYIYELYQNGSNWWLGVRDGKPYTEPASWYLANDWTDNWDPGTAFENIGNNTYQLVCDSYNSNNPNFYLNDGKTWYVCYDQNNKVTQLKNGVTYSDIRPLSNSNTTLPASANGKRVVFTLTVDNDGNPASFKAEWEEPVVWYLKRTNNGWSSDAEPFIGDGKVLTRTFKYSKDEEFKVWGLIGSEDLWYSKEADTNNAKYANGESSSISTSGSNDKLSDDADGKEVTLILTLGDDNKPSSLKAVWTDFYIYYKLGKDGKDSNFMIKPNADGSYSYDLDYTYNEGAEADLKFHFYSNVGGVWTNYGDPDGGGWKGFNLFPQDLSAGNETNFYVNGNDAKIKGKITFIVDPNFQTVSIKYGASLDDEFVWYAIRNEGSSYEEEQLLIFKWNEKGKYYETFMSSAWDDNQFKVYVSPDLDGARRLSLGFGDAGYNVVPNGGEKPTLELNKSALTFLPGANNPGEDYEVRLYVANGKGSLPVSLEFIMVPDFNGMPFYPKNMSDADFEEIKDTDTPFYYLEGHALNNWMPSPEWQFDVDENGKYYIDFTWLDHVTDNGCGGNESDNHKLDVKVVKYVANQTTNAAADVTDFIKVPLDFQTAKGRYYGKAGVRARAYFDPSNTSIPLTFTYLTFDGKETNNVAEAQHLPMVSLIGKNWLQSEDVPVNINIPKADKKFDANWDITTKGWQQSWIQYDNNGDVVKSRDGRKVYFNTQWPPINPISFTTSYTDETGEHVIELSSDNLTFTQQSEPKPASYWKNNGFEFVEFNCEQPGENGEDGSLYALYTVEDMWITGDFKLWNGWSGSRKNDSGEGADWTWNWGHESETAWPGTWNVQQNELQTGTGQVYLGLKNGDMTFNSPVHFSNVYFFFDINHPNNTETVGKDVVSIKHNLLYFEKSKISILAEGKELKYGMFTPALEELEESSYISEIKLTVHQNNDEKTYVDDVWVGKVPEGTTINDPASFLQFFKDNFTENSNGNLLWDTKEYASGSYVYKLQVTVVNSLGGVTPLYTQSNPFRIYNNAVEHKLSARQLIALPKDAELDYAGDITGYDYISYSSTFENVLVKVDANGAVTSMVNKPASLSNADVEDIYNNTGVWSNKVLLRTSRPTGYTAAAMEVDRVDEPSFKLYDTAETALNGKELKKVGSYYATIVDRADNFSNKTFRSQMNGKVQIEDTEKDLQEWKEAGTISAPNASIAYTPVIPTPRVKEAYIELYYGADNSNTEESNNDAKTFYFTSDSGKEYQITSARYQNVREIVEIDLPNVDDAIKEAANNLFNYYFEMYGGDVPTEEFTVDDNGSLPAENVIPSKLFTVKKGGDCDSKLVKFKTDHQSLYDRGWNSINPGLITSLEISTDAPLNESQKPLQSVVEVSNAKVLYEEGRYPYLTGMFDIHVLMEVPDENGNSADHVGKPEDDGLLHNDKEEGRYDYYFVSVGKANDPKGEERPILKGFEANDFAEDVATVEDMHPGDGNRDGYTMTIRYDLGETPNDTESVEAKIEKLKEYIKSLQLRVSYLYPFWVDDEKHGEGNNSGMARVQAKLIGDVLKSEATTWDLDATPISEGIMTGIDGIVYGAEGNFEVGRGYIDLHGNEGNIYSAEGARIYAGSGRTYVAPGVYVVTINGLTKKVMVK